MTADASLPHRFFKGQDDLKGPLPADLVAPSYRAEIVGFPPMDADGHGHFGRAFYAAFPDMRHRIDAVVASAPHVAVRFTLLGTQTGDFLGVPATGRPVEVTASAFLTVDDGRVTRLRAQFDQLGLLKQIGAV